jgi:hypothetical protein
MEFGRGDMGTLSMSTLGQKQTFRSAIATSSKDA